MFNPVIFLGQIIKPHGIKGEVFVKTEGDYFSFLNENHSLDLYKFTPVKAGIIQSAQPERAIQISARPRKVLHGYYLKFLGVDDRTAAENFRDFMLGIGRTEFLAEVDHPEQYLVSYTGMHIIDADSGSQVGTVYGVEGNEKNMWLYCKLLDNRDFLLPLEGDSITDTNYEKNRLSVRNYLSFVSE